MVEKLLKAFAEKKDDYAVGFKAGAAEYTREVYKDTNKNFDVLKMKRTSKGRDKFKDKDQRDR